MNYDDAVRAARCSLATIAVEGLEGLGIQLAELLIRLNVGTLILRDPRPVSAEIPGFRAIEQGRPRSEAAAERLSSQAEQTVVLEAFEGTAIAGADLHLVTAAGALEADALRRAYQESAAVLPVLVTAQGWRAGPLLLPGAPVCPECLLHTGLLTQTTPQATGSDPGESTPAGPAAAALVMGAAAAAAQQASALIQGSAPPAIHQAALVCEAGTGLITPQLIQPVPNCACFTAALPVGL
ncbi:hypothetical protein [Nesterenkonia alkaliphila]|uniref:THIF-type NAD/FAD binding fold domain-containing protein n=1 Tax=Nesterenkonia alkaliphila TaxID=1463631 RepID=A0A7K1UH24_9MICC|nr:hypothetical protein [Nesterenkonia alkaliphila]MVT25704.1 hypothetical protein [Nesterenkonia alkaliphila]GFZ85247.1 hypothetical protein GCM10011359_12920 [Nesterenkonia alkaliphila]